MSCRCGAIRVADLSDEHNACRTRGKLVCTVGDPTNKAKIIVLYETGILLPRDTSQDLACRAAEGKAFVPEDGSSGLCLLAAHRETGEAGR